MGSFWFVGLVVLPHITRSPVGSFWFVGLVVLPHITRSPVMSTIYMVHFEFEFT
jgi:hypothetical protein